MRQQLWLLLWIGVLAGCNRPCENSAQCGAGETCVSFSCQLPPCDSTLFAVDPAVGACVPLSPCFLTAAQREWQSCAENPCAGATEEACLVDPRCQPVYQNPDIPMVTSSLSGPPCAAPANTSPGVHNGPQPKYPPTLPSCALRSSRAYAGCRAVPRVSPQAVCESLDRDACALRGDCITDLDREQGRQRAQGEVPASSPGSWVGTAPRPLLTEGQTCFTRITRRDGCAAHELSCLTDPACQPIGTQCYCPAGTTCPCEGGRFLGCEPNDRLRRCTSDAGCRSGERCDRDEACIAPRTYPIQPTVPAAPGSSRCLGACVPRGCAGFGEAACQAHPECDGGVHVPVCQPAPYCAGGPADPTDPTPLNILCGCSALINRLDLARPGDCGEARITYALNLGYVDAFQRMTLIFEMRMPDDGMGCRMWAQRWGELSLIGDPAMRLRRLQALYDGLLLPERLAQVRTNEFLNRARQAPWELRQFHLGADGMLEPAPVSQTVDPRSGASSPLRAWAQANLGALREGTAIVPEPFLAAASVENGGRLKFEGSDRSAALKEAEKALNALSCAGCHLTETRSPFVHIGERLGQGGKPSGRAVVDAFLLSELPRRMGHLRGVLRGREALRGAALARVH